MGVIVAIEAAPLMHIEPPVGQGVKDEPHVAFVEEGVLHGGPLRSEFRGEAHRIRASARRSTGDVRVK